MWLLAALFLSPVLDDPGPLRLVSEGTGGEPVLWRLDGRIVATTWDDRPATIHAEAGEHQLWAATNATGPWQVLARTEPERPGEAAYVAAWTAHHEGEAAPGRPAAWPPWVVAAIGAALVLWPSRPKHP